MRSPASLTLRIPQAYTPAVSGETEPLTDGLLALRRLFGFSGGTLINGAVDLVHCTRCDAPAIDAYLDAMGAPD